jgi:glycogen operon protein
VGVNFAVWAPHATALKVCLYDASGFTETARLPMRTIGNGIWTCFAPGCLAGQIYALRAHGPWEPAAGHRFNPARLLLDPWAKALMHPGGQPLDALALQTSHHAADPFHPERSWSSHHPDPTDNADQMPRCVVVDNDAERTAPPHPRTPDTRMVLYEAHVKSLTQLHPDVPEPLRGTYAGLAHPAVVAHLKRLGVTTLCLLPVHAHITERHLLARHLVNHWGYNTLNAFAPEHHYAACTGGRPPANAEEAQAVRQEFRLMVDTLHAAGLEVVLDVVFNHTCESDPDGPTLSWRGLGQTDWYAMSHDGIPHNFTGCGNTLNTSQPRVLQWIMDSLRWWVQVHGVDGFRFDLAVTLGRDAALDYRFNPHHALFSAMTQDPVLSGVRLIAEPWDIGPDGYKAGRFAPGWCEWNDTFRDNVRAFWLGHPATRGQLATRQCASSDLFQHHQRPPAASINLLAAHDGFNLHDLTAYNQKHNQANGEDNRDGHGHNLSANAGVEGDSDDPAVLHRRGLLRRALLATLFCAQGTPQLLAGDELGHSQQGNNNAYCQDNLLTWLDWSGPDAPALSAFIGGLTALRRELPALRHGCWFTGMPYTASGWCESTHPTQPDIDWLDASGHGLSAEAWGEPEQRTLGALITVGEPGYLPTQRVLLVWHASNQALDFRLPPGTWTLRMDSAQGQVWPAGAPPLHLALLAPLHHHLPLYQPGVMLLVQPLLDGVAPTVLTS